MLASVIIPNYNGLRFLKKCLESVEKLKIGDWRLEIIVVDNGSKDESIEYLKTQKSKIIKNKENLGFAKAVNQGIRKAAGEYIFLLNNDVVLKPDYLERLVDFLEENYQFWAVQGLILTRDGKKIDNAGGKILWKGKVKIIPKTPNFQNSKLPNYQNSKLLSSSSEQPLILSATATLYRKSFFKKVGLFDEDFHSYLEDVDISLRAWRKGLKLTVLPEAICYHKGQVTSRRMGNLKARMDAKNWFFVIVKNWPRDKLIKYFFHIFIERLRNLSGLVKQTPWWQIPSAVFSVYFTVLINLPKLIWKRWH